MAVFNKDKIDYGIIQRNDDQVKHFGNTFQFDLPYGP